MGGEGGAGMSGEDVDLGIMIDGFRAMIWLQEHGDDMQSGTFWCRDCARFAAALLHGATARESTTLRCATSQAMQRQVDAAGEVIKQRYP